MLTEKTVIEMERDQEELVRRREIVNIYRGSDNDRVLIASTVVDNRLIKPGDDISNEKGVVRRMCNALFIPTVVDREKARQALEAAKQVHAEAVQAREAAIKAAAKAFAARTKAKAAHAAAVASGLQAGIDTAAVIKAKAGAAHSAAVDRRDAAIVAATEAEDQGPPALAVLTAARQAHEDFEAADG